MYTSQIPGLLTTYKSIIRIRLFQSHTLVIHFKSFSFKFLQLYLSSIINIKVYLSVMLDIKVYLSVMLDIKVYFVNHNTYQRLNDMDTKYIGRNKKLELISVEL